MAVDRFGNPHAPNLPYARGKILSSTEDDFQKLELAWALIRERGPRNIYIFTGLEHSMPLVAEELEFADDEIAPALSFPRLKELALEHLGGEAGRDDVAIFNRLTGATMAHPSGTCQTRRRRDRGIGEP
jgi:hypothetical protein